MTDKNDTLEIAMVGLRGVPATWGGVERSVEELGARLVERGHRVTVFCRNNYQTTDATEHRGMQLVTLPTLGTKHGDAFTHSAISAVSALTKGFDVVNYHTIGPGLVAPITRWLSSAKVVLTVRGLDNHRAKWGSTAKRVLDLAEWMSGHVPNHVIAVSRDLRRHYETHYKVPISYIPNGIDAPLDDASVASIERFGLEPESYALFVGRLVPEKAPDRLLRNFKDVPGDLQLVVAGGSSFTDTYVGSLEELARNDPRIKLAGYVYGQELRSLYRHARFFVTPSLLEGLPRTLLEAASHGVPVVASDIPPHLEILGPDQPGHMTYAADSDAEMIRALTQMSEDFLDHQAGAKDTREEVLQTYSWDRVVDETEALYRSLVRR